MCFFFFSSRRRHTRWPRDWSSDVCSSDLGGDRLLDQIHWQAVGLEGADDRDRFARLPALVRVQPQPGRRDRFEDRILAPPVLADVLDQHDIEVTVYGLRRDRSQWPLLDR